jgi:hypothetical protein
MIKVTDRSRGDGFSGGMSLVCMYLDKTRRQNMYHGRMGNAKDATHSKLEVTLLLAATSPTKSYVRAGSDPCIGFTAQATRLCSTYAR